MGYRSLNIVTLAKLPLLASLITIIIIINQKKKMAKTTAATAPLIHTLDYVCSQADPTSNENSKSKTKICIKMCSNTLNRL